jgi:hypothetical protein
MERVLAVILCGLSLAATTQPAGDDSSKTLAETRAEVQKMNKDWATLPAIQAKSLLDLVRFRLNNDLLLVDSPVYQGKTAAYQVQVNGHDGLGSLRLNVSRFPGVYYIQLQYYDLSVPGMVERHLDLISSPIKVIILADFQYADRVLTISLEESADPGSEAPVVLRVQDDLEAGGTPGVGHHAYLADSLSDLRAKHPLECEKYLRPLMRAYEQEQIGFYVEDRMGWQVVADTWVPPGDLKGRVDPLVAQLNSDDYAARAEAQKGLEEIGEPAALYLLSTSQAGLSAEQTARLKKFLAPYRPLDDQTLAQFRKDPNFLIDMLYNEHRELRAAALIHLNRVVGREIHFDLDLAGDQRVAAVAKLRGEIAPAQTQPAGN